jgi:hypothetical protein
MAEFGKRNVGVMVQVSSRPQAAQADFAGALAAAKTGKLPYWTKSGPLRFVFIMLACAGAFWFLTLPNAGAILRDHRLAGSWRPAYDMQVVDGKCTRFNFVITDCDAKIKSLAEPDQAPLPIHYQMLFTSGGGVPLVAVRSTVDPTVVTIAYAAETELANRTVTFFVMAAIFAAGFLGPLRLLLKGRYKGGAAHVALMAGFAELQARVASAGVETRAAA